MPIYQFDTESDYSQHIKSTSESEVSLIKENYNVKYDGINVRVERPKFGDALYLDTTSEINGSYEKYFIDGASLNTSLLPNYLVPVGVVFAVEHNKVFILYYNGYNNEDVKVPFVNSFLFQIDALVDGQQHSIQFRQVLNSLGLGYYQYLPIGTFTHSCSTQEQFSQELDTWLRANQGGIAAGGDWDYNWHCEYRENYQGIMKPFVVIDNAVDTQQYHTDAIIGNAGSSTARARIYMTSNIPLFYKFYRRNSGANSCRIGLNYKKLLEYLTVQEGEELTEMVPATADTDTLVTKTQFEENQYCAELRAVYDTFEDYIHSIMLRYPSLKSGLGIEYRKSLEWTNALATLKNTKLDGSEIYTFPIHAWTHSLNFNSDGLREGEWHLPNVDESYNLYKNITYDLEGITISNCDQLNKTIEQMHGAHISNLYSFWTTCLYARNAVWMCGSSNGYTSYAVLSKKFKAVAITDITI